MIGLESLWFIYHYVNTVHVVITVFIVMAIFLIIQGYRVPQINFIVGISLLQQAILNGCFLTEIQNKLSTSLGINKIDNLFLFGIFDGNNLWIYRIIIGIIALIILADLITKG
jgi:hypothetical protein